MLRSAIITIFIGFFSLISSAQAVPPIEAYGELPTIREMVISPSGNEVAYITLSNGNEAMAVYRFGEGIVYSIATNGLNVRNLEFATDDHVVLLVSEAARVRGFRGKFEQSGAFAINYKKNIYTPMFKENTRMKTGKGSILYPAQSGLGVVVGKVPGKDQLFMPAFGKGGSYAIFRVDLNTGAPKLHRKGSGNTDDWFVDAQGNVIAREDIDERRNEYSIWANRNGKFERIYQRDDTEQTPFSLVGSLADGTGLVVGATSSETGFYSLFKLGFDGVISDEMFRREDASVEYVMTDINRIVYGVEYGGLYPSYSFFDETVTSAMESLEGAFEGSSVHLVNWSDGFNKLLIKVAGGGLAGDYYLFDRVKNELSAIASSRAAIQRQFVADINTIEYKARDGLTIPSILTWPVGVEERKNMPLIAMPHGGPESYDQVGFDWMAQYFASRGYLVLQPNFRGSEGFGLDFNLAGRGKWGKEMQDDITDGVDALIKGGFADPDRVCIIGASYGGYAALAGGAFTPDLYSCVGAIAPVSDLPRMLRAEKQDNGKNSWVLAYWERVIGDLETELDKLEEISPVNFASEFQAPVLLIHGKDDTVVPLRQSEVMNNALKRADKEVEFVTLKGEDHWLSSSETRLQTLQALDAFVEKHIGE